jgi:hypothetical protein
MWRVTAAGEPADTVLRLSSPDPLGLILFRDCGEFSGGWAAGTAGAFIGSVEGWDMACMNYVKGDSATPAWLANARKFRVQGDERDLMAANGTVVARLLPGGKPRPVQNLIRSLQQPPTLDPAAAEKLRAAPRPLPAGVPPATSVTILGKWKPDHSRPGQNGKEPFAEFDADGSWKSYDGCNGGGGRWALGPAGEFVSIAGATAGVGCAGPVTDIPLEQVRRAAVAGDVLTLYAANGKLVARLTR